MKFIRSISLSLVLLMLPLAAFAQAEVGTTYDRNTKNVTISGTFDGEVNRAVSIMILPSGTKKESLTENIMNENQYITRQVKCAEDGSFTLDVTMPENAPGNVYDVYAACGVATITGTFSHVNDGEVKIVVKQVNDASVAPFEAADVEKIIKDSQVQLGLSDDVIKLAEGIADTLYAQRPSGGYSFNTFLEELNRAIALELLKAGEGAADVLKNYGNDFGFSQSDLKKVSEKTLSELNNQIKTQKIQNGTKAFLYECLLLSDFAVAESYVETGAAIENWGKGAGINLTGYNKLTDNKKTAVMKDLYSDSVNDFSSLNDSFESAVEDAQSTGTGTGGGGGGGGGSRGSGGGFSAVGSAPEAVTSSYKGFSDMENHWGRAYVEKLTEKGIVSGFADNTYRPEALVTRAEFTKLVLMMTGGAQVYENLFDDCTPADWYYSYIAGAKKLGLVDGYNNKFRPNDNITREDAAVILYRAFKDKSGEAQALSFADEGSISDYAKEAVAYLTAKGIITGSDSGFLPKNFTKRAEAAAMICRMLECGGGV